MRAKEEGSMLQVTAQKETGLQHPVFQIPAIFSVLFLCLPSGVALGRPHDTGLIEYGSACSQIAQCLLKMLMLLLTNWFLMRTFLLFPCCRIHTGSDGHTDATCCSCYSSRDVQNLHNGRGMVCTRKLVLNGISGDVGWSREAPDLMAKLYCSVR